MLVIVIAIKLYDVNYFGGNEESNVSVNGVNALSLRLVIKGFKSIEQAELELRPLTILIGPPGSGKSNTLEALGSFTYFTYGGRLEDYFRWESLAALSHELVYPEAYVGIYEADKKLASLRMGFGDERVNVMVEVMQSKIDTAYYYNGDMVTYPSKPPEELEALLRIRFYRYIPKPSSAHVQRYDGYITRGISSHDIKLYEELLGSILMPPAGDNLIGLAKANREVSKLISEILEGKLGYTGIAVMKVPIPSGPPIEQIVVLDKRGDMTTLIPLNLLSDGIIQYLLVAIALKARPPERIPTIIPDIIVLEEPESHLFPYLVNTMAEDLAKAAQNGTYVILSTHNPYLLVALLEKAPKDKLALYYVYMDEERRKTRFARVGDDLIGEILDYEYASLFTIEDILRDSGLIK